ncbi:alpha/beta hydrolase [Capnocytophaga sp.]|uniref:alpha/beta hydrolase n=1 Tax=Capnocytophaga sp. TaxID=44737 RepID=UPI0026DC45FF|nr:alpha/beta fold hydrolase [Capnocytophaga sp.]MDO5105574.1 alpha/beta fold hydrolase [Capnocytophaga sp.]
MNKQKLLVGALLLSCFWACSPVGTDAIALGDENPSVNAPLYDVGTIINEPLRINYANGNKKITIYGEIIAPKGYEKQPLPLVILATGFGGSLDFVASQYAEAIAKEGFITYSFDFYGGNVGSRSGGTMQEMSVFTQTDDLVAVLNHLSGLPFVDKNAVFLLGYSQGGLVSAIAAAENTKKVKGAVLLNAAFSLPDFARYLFKSVDDIPQTISFEGHTLGKVYFERLLSYDIYAQLPAFKNEVLLIHAQNDELIPLLYAEKAHQIYPKSELRIIKGATHLFSEQENTTLFPFIKSYLKRNTTK